MESGSKSVKTIGQRAVLTANLHLRGLERRRLQALALQKLADPLLALLCLGTSTVLLLLEKRHFLDFPLSQFLEICAEKRLGWVQEKTGIAVATLTIHFFRNPEGGQIHPGHP